ncbi:hypothetical protein J4Q44_G00165480 [Coregonus suidteri]|uniref:C1q domain-containing protein n=1 Tax=Coregonus suidteri TaxID=861788 RepID=A0AAN8M728_9TELE
MKLWPATSVTSPTSRASCGLIQSSQTTGASSCPSPSWAPTCASRSRITNDSNAEEVPCFLAGDERANENIALTTMHTMMLREHNRLARALTQLNPHWTGEITYQETRKIMGAYFQVITFRDYLFHIVGPDFIARQLSTYPGYDENVDPSISNVFATATYHFTHLSIQPFIFCLDENYTENAQFPSPLLHRAFFAPCWIVFEGPQGPHGLPGIAVKSAFAVRLGYNYPKPGQPIQFCENVGNVDLRKNGQLVLHSFTTQQTGYITATGGTLLQLNKGDKIWLSANYGGNGITSDSFFSGHLISTV